MKKIKIVHFLFITSSYSWAGIINTNCFDIDTKGALIHNGQNIGCQSVHTIEYDSTHAKGLINTNPFEISIIKKNNNETMIYEIAPDSMNWSISANLGATSTYIKNGKISDQTICSRHISKSNPIISNDEMNCMTVNQTFCTNFFKTLKQFELNKEDISKKLDQIKKCQDIIDNQIYALSDAMKMSFLDPDYKNLSKERYEDLKLVSSKSINANLKSSLKWSYNDSVTKFDSVKSKFSDISYGYSWMKTMFDKCVNYFPPNDSTTSDKKNSLKSVQK